VLNAAGASIASSEPRVASVRPPGNVAAPLTHIASDREKIEIVGNQGGGAVIAVNLAAAPPLSLPQSLFVAAITVGVLERRKAFTPTMGPHDPQPTRRWNTLLKAIEQPADNVAGLTLKGLCVAGADPMTFVNAAIVGEFSDKPIALKHLNWYLRDG